MTTVSSTPAATPTTTSTASSASTTAPASSPAPYNGTAAIAQAKALLADRIASGASGSGGNLLGLSPDILSLLQGGTGTDAIGTLFGGDKGNAFFSVQSLTALYGAKAARAKANLAAVSPIDKLIAASNAVLNANTSASLATSKANTTPATSTTTPPTNTTA